MNIINLIAWCAQPEIWKLEIPKNRKKVRIRWERTIMFYNLEMQELFSKLH